MKTFKLRGYTKDEDGDGQGGEKLDIEAETNFPTEHHGCFAHVLHLVVRDGVKVAKQIDNIILKCSKIVSHIRKLQKHLRMRRHSNWLMLQVGTPNLKWQDP